MAENVKAEALPDLDDLLQCPVCYEIPSGQIFQCNEGHHVCGRCKARLSQCPVCRALFFGTRNYAMEELIANVKKLRAFKLGGKVTTGSSGSGSNTPAEEDASGDGENDVAEDENNLTDRNLPVLTAPPACKGLFRCFCCKNGNSIRLPAARLLNHLRYFHSPDLIEGQSENNEYVQAWQFPTIPGRIVTAVRVSDMGIFFLTIDISNELVYAYLSMAASPWVSNSFSYTVTISGNDREAIFSDCVWSVRSCEGVLKKRRRCLVVNGVHARALVAPATINCKLSVSHVRSDDAQRDFGHPRAVLRVANRGAAARDPVPLLHELQSSVARLSRAFATLEGQVDTRLMRDNTPPSQQASPARQSAAPLAEQQPAPESQNTERPLSRNARRRMRQRLRATLNENQDASERVATQNRPAQRPNGHLPTVHSIGHIVVVPASAAAATSTGANSNARRQNNNAPANPIRRQSSSAAVQPSPTAAARPRNQLEAVLQRNVTSNLVHTVQTGLAIVQQTASAPRRAPAPVPAPATAGEPSGAAPQNGGRANKKKHRQRK